MSGNIITMHENELNYKIEASFNSGRYLSKIEPCSVCAERLRQAEIEADRRLTESVEIADNVQRIVDDLERELYDIPAYVSDAKVARYAELKRSIIRKQQAGV